MRTRLAALWCLLPLLVVTSPTPALEKTVAPLDDERSDAWNAGLTCVITYYNYCTGWIWNWSFFSPSDRFGVCYESCESYPCALVESWQYVSTGAPSGYGFTGTIAVSAVDANCCPVGAPLQTQVFLPVAGWNGNSWWVLVPARFAIHVTLGPAPDSPLVVSTDHPAPGPTGPPACGTCYPATRVNHSYYWDPDAICPGSPFFDGLCDAQLLWDCGMICKWVGAEPRSWGSIKSLYR